MTGQNKLYVDILLKRETKDALATIKFDKSLLILYKEIKYVRIEAF